MLILKVNTQIGIPNLAFALGDQAINNLITGIQMMPQVIMVIVVIIITINHIIQI